MPKLVQATPKYRKHRASGQAIVSIGGRDIYLGPHGTKASHTEYDRVVAEADVQVGSAGGNDPGRRLPDLGYCRGPQAPRRTSD